MSDLYEFRTADDLRGVTVIHGEFVVATSERSDCDFYRPFTDLLASLKDSLAMDVLFVAQAVDGEPVPRAISAASLDPGCDAAEEEYGHAMLDLAVAGADGQHRRRGRLSLPVIAGSWSYGTVCCALQGATATSAEAKALHSVARVMGQALAQQRQVAPLPAGTPDHH